MDNLKLEDIAKLAGVSRSTVSRVVNGSTNVGVETRKRVEKIIQRTGYHPNMAARSLVSQRTNIIGLVIPKTTQAFFTDPYFPQLTQGVAFACNDLHLTLALFLVGNEEDEAEITPRIIRRGMLDGILVQTSAKMEGLFKRLLSSSMPYLALGRPNDEDVVNYIDVDNIRGAKQATRHLLVLGYKRIGMIIGSIESAAATDRTEGFKQAMAGAGRKVDPVLVAEGDFSEVSGYEAMKKILPFNPDAVFAQSDIMALGAMRAVQEAGLNVPRDIALVGYDDLPLASGSSTKLTTIRQPITHFGIKAVEMLKDMIDNGTKVANRMILGTELVVRDTCGSSLKNPVSVQKSDEDESALRSLEITGGMTDQ
ncbi:MAG: LacI family DNA-binding transcriptional regulator [Anaerolineaceae bacterium]|jgi:LacI family transcriptional regulator|nr:LacI family DNA-binding transcriptional regulator [Anaerolineaceae bacterium]MDD4042875.1 LacI family DNA-binding transcriptional regulator [Anaerolineaceae bacterium]MDD4577133.1 LacI family DNA-binding transcriptional regulator [Anaerolineaceae bacterium]